MRSTLELVLSIGVAAAFLLWILFGPSRASSKPASVVRSENPSATVAGFKKLRIRSDSPLGRKLELVDLTRREISAPTLTVSGTVVASLRPGPDRAEPFWQFERPELLTLYLDWKKARADVSFLETQLLKLRELMTAKIAAQQRVVERLKKLVTAGTEAGKDLATEETALIELQIQASKSEHESESAMKVAKRTAEAIVLQLQQAGLEPLSMQAYSPDIDLVTAEVPEGKLWQVKTGQQCEARFFGLPDVAFSSKVSSIAPVLSSDRRTLHAVFIVDDPNDLLRPGMFAEIGLGTEPHLAMLIPSEGVIHVGRADYVFVADSDDGQFTAHEVKCGEVHANQIEILTGLPEGRRVIGSGAILLKPLLMQSFIKANGDRDQPGESRSDEKPEQGGAAPMPQGARS